MGIRPDLANDVASTTSAEHLGGTKREVQYVKGTHHKIRNIQPQPHWPSSKSPHYNTSVEGILAFIVVNGGERIEWEFSKERKRTAALLMYLV